MKPQSPAEGIMLLDNFEKAKRYRIECSCGNPDDSIDVWIEVDETEIVLQFYTTQSTDWWEKLAYWNTFHIDNYWLYSIVNGIKSLINGFYHKIKITRDVWFNGHVCYESTTIMTKQQALNFAETVKKCIKEMEKNEIGRAHV